MKCIAVAAVGDDADKCFKALAKFLKESTQGVNPYAYMIMSAQDAVDWGLENGGVDRRRP